MSSFQTTLQRGIRQVGKSAAAVKVYCKMASVALRTDPMQLSTSLASIDMLGPKAM